MSVAYLTADPFSFPPVESALHIPNGLLAIGGDLSLQRLITAYQKGIFPWFSTHSPILWWSPNPRAILYPNELHISRSTIKTWKRSNYQITMNKNFLAVIQGCATARKESSWITSEVIQAYHRLHLTGYAHSIEVWQEGFLVGGLYGVALGKIFFAESMFSRQSNTSKFALKAFCQHFISCGGELIDCQILNPHTASLGVREISRADFITQLSKLCQFSLSSHCWQAKNLSITHY